MELNREQIVKALECYSKGDCDNCPNPFGNCYETLAEFALALISELTEEKERLRDNLERTEKALIALDKAHNALFTDSFRIETEAKADTVRKMQERFNQVFGGMDATNALLRRTFDQIAKELLEDSENGCDN